MWVFVSSGGPALSVLDVSIPSSRQRLKAVKAPTPVGTGVPLSPAAKVPSKLELPPEPAVSSLAPSAKGTSLQLPLPSWTSQRPVTFNVPHHLIVSISRSLFQSPKIRDVQESAGLGSPSNRHRCHRKTWTMRPLDPASPSPSRLHGCCAPRGESLISAPTNQNPRHHRR